MEKLTPDGVSPFLHKELTDLAKYPYKTTSGRAAVAGGPVTEKKSHCLEKRSFTKEKLSSDCQTEAVKKQKDVTCAVKLIVSNLTIWNWPMNCSHG
jgi:hypothetical protein